MAQTERIKADAAHRAAVIAKAFVRAGANLDLTNRVLGAVIGLSESSVSRLRGGDERLLSAGTKPYELATLFLRLYRSLDAIVGGDDKISVQWLRNRNLVLGDAPINLIQTARGLIRVTDYLDARRAVT